MSTNEEYWIRTLPEILGEHFPELEISEETLKALAADVAISAEMKDEYSGVAAAVGPSRHEEVERNLKSQMENKDRLFDILLHAYAARHRADFKDVYFRDGKVGIYGH